MKTKQLLSLLMALVLLAGLVPALGDKSSKKFDVSVFEKGDYIIDNNTLDGTTTITYYDDELFSLLYKGLNSFVCEPAIFIDEEGDPFFIINTGLFLSVPPNLTHVRFKGNGLEYTTNSLTFETDSSSGKAYEYCYLFLDRQGIKTLEVLTRSDVVTVTLVGKESTYKAFLSSLHLEVLLGFIKDFYTATKGTFGMLANYPYDVLSAADSKTSKFLPSLAQSAFDLSLFEKNEDYVIEPDEEFGGYNIDLAHLDSFAFSSEDYDIYSCYPYITVNEEGEPKMALYFFFSPNAESTPISHVFFTIDEDIYSLSTTFYPSTLKSGTPFEYTNVFLGEKGFNMLNAIVNAKEVSLGFVTEDAVYATPFPPKALPLIEQITGDFLTATGGSFGAMDEADEEEFLLTDPSFIDPDSLNPDSYTLFKRNFPASFDFGLFENRQYTITPYRYGDAYDISFVSKIRERFFLDAKREGFYIICDPSIAVEEDGEIFFSLMLSCVSTDFLSLDKVFFRLDDAYYTADVVFSLDADDDDSLPHEYVFMELDESGFDLIQNMENAKEVEIGFISSEGIFTRPLAGKALAYLVDMAETFAQATSGTYGMIEDYPYDEIIPIDKEDIKAPSALSLNKQNSSLTTPCL